jgi:hypothetical protein
MRIHPSSPGFASNPILVVLDVHHLIDGGPQMDNVVHALELAESEGAVARRVVLADELLRRADDAVERRRKERSH